MVYMNRKEGAHSYVRMRKNEALNFIIEPFVNQRTFSENDLLKNTFFNLLFFKFKKTSLDDIIRAFF